MADYPRIAMAESMATQPQYKLMRTLASQVGETDPPVSGAFVISTPRSNYADILIVGTGVGGTVAADQIVFSTYRLVSTKSATAVIEPCDRYVMDASKYATPVTRTIRDSARNLWTVVTFIGGTLPTFSGSIYVRGVHEAGLTANDFPKDPDGIPYGRGLEFDPLTGGAKVTPLRDISDQTVQETICDLTGANVVTTTYDIDMINYSDLSLIMTWMGDVAAVAPVKVAFLATNDVFSASPQYAVITASVWDETNLAFLAPDATGDVTAPTASATVGLVFEKKSYQRIRIRITSAGDADDILKINANKRYGG